MLCPGQRRSHEINYQLQECFLEGPPAEIKNPLMLKNHLMLRHFIVCCACLYGLVDWVFKSDFVRSSENLKGSPNLGTYEIYLPEKSGLQHQIGGGEWVERRGRLFADTVMFYCVSGGSDEKQL